MINPIFEIVNIAAAARIGGFHEITFRGKMHGVGKYRFGDEDIEGLNKVIASVRQAVDGYNDLIDIETNVQKIHGYEAIISQLEAEIAAFIRIKRKALRTKTQPDGN